MPPRTPDLPSRWTDEPRASARAVLERTGEPYAARFRLLLPALTEAGEADTDAETFAAESLVPQHLLSGDEIVIFAVKPSLWFIVFTSARWLAAMILVIILAGWIERLIPRADTLLVIQAALAFGAARVGLALLQWVARLYVLTNRRIMRFTGILNVDIFECPLTKIQNTYLTLAWYERLTRLGSIAFATAGTGGIEASWTHVNNPLETHERVRSAIHRAQRPPNGL